MCRALIERRPLGLAVVDGPEGVAGAPVVPRELLELVDGWRARARHHVPVIEVPPVGVLGVNAYVVDDDVYLVLDIV